MKENCYRVVLESGISVTEKNPVTCIDCEKLLFYQSTDITIILFGKTLTSEQTSRENIFKAKQKIPLKRVQLSKYIIPSVKSLKKMFFISYPELYVSPWKIFRPHVLSRQDSHSHFSSVLYSAELPCSESSF